MENATKALLIAGGILLALMIITFGIYIFNYIHEIKTSEATKTEKEQLQEFNYEYEHYNKQLMYGADIISVYNKIQNNNKYNKYNLIDFKVTFLVDNDEKTIEIVNGNLEQGNIEEINKTSMFKCIGVTYDNGRVKSMRFAYYEYEEQ